MKSTMSSYSNPLQATIAVTGSSGMAFGERPNPIAASVVEILAVRDDELDVVGLDCLDNTPLLDFKRTRYTEGSETASVLS